MANSSRIGAIDFWRGLVLIAILVDHIPGNWLEYATPRNFGLSDSSEAFIFLSGVSVGIVYVPRARKRGLGAAAFGCLKRALKLYSAHIAMTVVALLIFAMVSYFSGLDELLTSHGRSLVLVNPMQGVSGIILLSHQIGYFNILPLYIALMFWAPIVVGLSLIGPGWALAASTLVYAGARIFGLNLPNWPEAGSWFFNPLAWQLLFTMGVAAAQIWRERLPTRTTPRIVVAAAVLVAGALLVSDALGLAPGLRTAAWAHLDLGKQNLALSRLAHFCALAYLVAGSRTLTEFAVGRFGLSLQSLGRHSLPVFVFGSICTAIGQAATAVGEANLPGLVVHVLELTYTILAIALSFLLAHHLDCEDTRRATHLSSPRSRWWGYQPAGQTSRTP